MFGEDYSFCRFWTAYSVPTTFLISTTGLSPLFMPKYGQVNLADRRRRRRNGGGQLVF
jgi:hypothetical protein